MMFYRETGQFKSKYKEELAAFPLAEDKVGIAILLVIAYIFIPIFGIPGLSYDFTMGAIMIPVFIFTITTLGLNILLGFAGQISLGLSLIHISEPTRRTPISYAVFCLKKKK